MPWKFINRRRVAAHEVAAWRRLVRVSSAVIALVVASSTYAAEGDVAEPRRLSDDEVPYPSGATGGAEVVLELHISPEGYVTDARLRYGRNPFAQTARQAALSWRFAPAMRNGVPIARRISTRIIFTDPINVIPALSTPSDDSGGSSLVEDSELGDMERLGVDEVVVYAERQNEIGGTLIPRAEARQIPGAFADPFRVAEILPGIAPIVSGLPYFFVRGSPPGNVSYLVDDIRVPLLFHVGAGSSILAPGLIERVDIIPSGYSARFGRVAGGIMSGETTASSGVTHGELQARLFDSSALLEIPLAGRESSVLVGGRYGYLQPLLDQVAPDYELGYWDYQARVNYQPSEANLFTLFSFGASDRLKSRGHDVELFNTTFHRLDLRWDHLTSESRTRIAVTGGTDRIANATDQDEVDFSSELRTRGLRVRFETSQSILRDVVLRIGGDAGLDEVENETVQRPTDPLLLPPRTDLYSSLYLDAVVRTPRVELVPGLRLDGGRWRGDQYIFAEPRLGARIDITEGFSWISQLGVSHQLPTQNVRVPGQAADVIESSVQEAWQAAQGFALGRSSTLLGKITVFHSWIAARESGLSGRSYGVEAFLRRNFTDGIGGILSYSLSRTETTVGRDTLPSEFDRTHVVSFVLGWHLGAGYSLGLRTYYATGQRYTALCPTADCTSPGDPSAPISVRHEGRLPGFYRADFRFEKRWELGLTSWMALTFEWFNATLSKETIGREWSPTEGRLVNVELDRLTLPSLGLEAGF